MSGQSPVIPGLRPGISLQERQDEGLSYLAGGQVKPSFLKCRAKPCIHRPKACVPLSPKGQGEALYPQAEGLSLHPEGTGRRPVSLHPRRAGEACIYPPRRGGCTDRLAVESYSDFRPQKTRHRRAAGGGLVAVAMIINIRTSKSEF